MGNLLSPGNIVKGLGMRGYRKSMGEKFFDCCWGRKWVYCILGLVGFSVLLSGRFTSLMGQLVSEGISTGRLRDKAHKNRTEVAG